MLDTFRQFRWHFLAFLFLVLLHGFIPTPARAEEALPADVAKTIAKADDDVGAIQAKADAEKFKVRKALIATLTKAQEKVIKSGNLDGANAIKARITDLEKLTAAPDLLNTAPPASVRERLLGSFAYDFSNGHKGVLQVKKGSASIPGFQGTVDAQGDAVVISWSNGTQWNVSSQAGNLVVTASDGASKLTPQQ